MCAGRHGMAAGALEQVAHGPVVRDRVRLGQHRPEPVLALPGGGDVTAALGVVEVGVLDVVVALVVGHPDLEVGALDGVAGARAHVAVEVARDARCAVGDVVTVRELRRVGHEERAEHRVLGRAVRHRVVDADDLHRQTEDVGQEDELLALVVGDVARAGQEVDPVGPLLLGELHVDREGVQVLHERLQHLLDARRLCVLEALQDDLRQQLVRQIAPCGVRHCQLPLSTPWLTEPIRPSPPPWRCPGPRRCTSSRARGSRRRGAPSRGRAS